MISENSLKITVNSKNKIDQIETASMMIQSIFNLIQRNAEVGEPENIDYYLDALIHLSEIGRALADSISEAVSSFQETGGKNEN